MGITITNIRYFCPVESQSGQWEGSVAEWGWTAMRIGTMQLMVVLSKEQAGDENVEGWHCASEENESVGAVNHWGWQQSGEPRLIVCPV